MTTSAEHLEYLQHLIIEDPRLVRTNDAFIRGQQAHYTGHNECPYLSGSHAERLWEAGWADAAAAARFGDELHYERSTLENYCKEV